MNKQNRPGECGGLERAKLLPDKRHEVEKFGPQFIHRALLFGAPQLLVNHQAQLENTKDFPQPWGSA